MFGGAERVGESWVQREHGKVNERNGAKLRIRK